MGRILHTITKYSADGRSVEGLGIDGKIRFEVGSSKAPNTWKNAKNFFYLNAIPFSVVFSCLYFHYI